MRNTLLISISAIALITGAGLAGAQEKSMGQGSGGQSAPAQMSPQGGADVKSGTTGQATPDAKGDREPTRAQPSKSRVQESGKDAQPKDAPKAGAAQRPADSKSGTSATESKSGQTETKGATTGQGAAGSASGSLTTEQRTQISTTIKQTNVRPVTNVNFSISVGTAIPRSVTLHPLPARVIEVYPTWRGYRFILVGGEIIIIEPASYKIVAVIAA